MSARARPVCLPPPAWSSHFYVRLLRKDVALFRFLLEAQDNLAYMSVADCHAAVLKVVCSPHQERAARAYLESVRQTVPFAYVPLPAPGTPDSGGPASPVSPGAAQHPGPATGPEKGTPKPD